VKDATSAVSAAGALYVVATPIGHLGDITLRALETLRDVDLIIAEDTRRSRVLLEHYDIETPFGLSLYEGVPHERVERILQMLKEGKRIALISDAGTPLIQDPGYVLVSRAVEEGLPVVPVPGPTALIAALVASGFPTDRFLFDGVPPKKPGKRRTYFESLKGEERTVVLYESPHRILKTLETLSEILPEREICLAREITKAHEEFLRGRPHEVFAQLKARPSIKGEFVLVIRGAHGRRP
jgi:16S rRNA (cytidine1402-2'-O)-methyltransferase